MRESSETEFRAALHEHWDVAAGDIAIRHISFVGAYDALFGGRDVDSVRYTDIMRYVAASGFMLAPDYTVDIVNFRDKRDFLYEETPTDMVITSNILAGNHPCLPRFWPKDATTYDKDILCVMVSRANSAHDWNHRVTQSGAKLVVTFGGELEVRAQYFGPQYEADYTVLIESPDTECCSRYTRQDELADLYPQYRGIDLPQGWLGFSARNDFLRAIAPSIQGHTFLTKQVKSAVPPAPAPE